MLQKHLVEVAIEQFGRYGFDGASTRDIARKAGTVMSSITYHFGGKRGLYLACADEIAEQINRHLALVLNDIPVASALSRKGAIEALLRIIDSLSTLMIHGSSQKWTRFIAREQMVPTEAFDQLWAALMAPILDTTSKLLAQAQPHLQENARHAFLMVLFSQPMAPRIARALACKSLGVEKLGDEEGGLLRLQIRRNTLSILSHELPGKALT